MKTRYLLLALASFLTLSASSQSSKKTNANNAFKAGMPPNLILNPGAEEGLDNWTIAQGVAESMLAFDCNGTEPYAGDYYFAVGGLCEFSDVPGVITQDIDMSMYADSIATGSYQANYGGYFSNWNNEDIPEMRLHYIDASDGLLSTSAVVSSLNNTWTMEANTELIPLGTAIIRVELTGIQIGGSFNDSYFDDLFVWLDMEEEVISVEEYSVGTSDLSVAPNPVTTSGTIYLPETQTGEVDILITDLTGARVSCNIEFYPNRVVLHNPKGLNGLYLFYISIENQPIGKGKIIFAP